MMIVNLDSKIKQLFEDYNKEPFQYGVSDCANFASDWVQRITGRDIISDFEEYSTEATAMSVLSSHGYKDQDELLDDYFKRVPKRRMKRGDLCGHYFEGNKIMAIGVYVSSFAMFRNDDGLVMVPYKMLDTNLCWSIQ